MLSIGGFLGMGTRLVVVPYDTLKFAGNKVTLPGGTKEGLKMRTAKILVQEYNFSPGGATYQREEQRFNLRQVNHLRLTIVPNKSGSGTATLTALRLFA